MSSFQDLGVFRSQLPKGVGLLPQGYCEQKIPKSWKDDIQCSICIVINLWFSVTHHCTSLIFNINLIKNFRNMGSFKTCLKQSWSYLPLIQWPLTNLWCSILPRTQIKWSSLNTKTLLGYSDLPRTQIKWSSLNTKTLLGNSDLSRTQIKWSSLDTKT